MAEFGVGESPYRVLGLEKAHESTEAEIKKVPWRILAFFGISHESSLNLCEEPFRLAHLAEVVGLLTAQAFRKLALTKHPDKQPDNPNAAAEFGLIQRAYEVLLDPAAKEAWDNLARRAALHPRCSRPSTALACNAHIGCSAG
jgi:hypothetical protein